MSDIVLTTFNARYTHTSLGLRYLYANLGFLQDNAKIVEFVINANIPECAESILAYNPKIVGIGAYIWNALDVQALVKLLKQIAPDVYIVLGGPEASHLPWRVGFEDADYIIQGEGEIEFQKLCESIMSQNAPKERFIKASPVDMSSIILPYDAYSEHDIAHRYCYVEASRGCPFGCEFCLSSLDKKVRDIPLEKFLKELEKLWNRGVRNFKFIDRTFNLDIDTASKLLDFFLAKEGEYFVHFEVIPERFPPELRERIARFSPASLQLEVGIQTLNPQIAKAIHRRINMSKIEENLAFLQQNTKAHLHVDLIIGLPGESVESFADGLNRLYSLTQCEIQIGILKKLSGTTLSRHDEEHGMIYSHLPPYEIMQNDLISFELMQRLKRFARFWDMVFNSGNFKSSAPLLWEDGDVFGGFLKFSDWLYEKTESTWQISLERLAKLLMQYLLTCKGKKEEFIREILTNDLLATPGRKLPSFLKTSLPVKEKREKTIASGNIRQQRHATKKSKKR
jgi:radical SAM superfamily enzyme YgiQ (UPF0313 family)